ncbi:putative reverse transcriptase domain-containing protein [Tanacetum coccineum]
MTSPSQSPPISLSHHPPPFFPMQESAFASYCRITTLTPLTSISIIPPLLTIGSRFPSLRLPRKEVVFVTLGYRYRVGESSSARPSRDPAEAVPEIAPVTLGEVNTRVTELAELHEHDTQDLYALLEDAQDRDSMDGGWEEAYVPVSLGSLDRIGVRRTSSRAFEPIVIMCMHTRPISRHTRHNYSCRVLSFRHIRDMRREMSDMQAELLSLREQQRRARQPGPEARIPDHQDASGDADSHIYSHEDNRRNVQTARPCFYADFMKCQPLNFKGTEGVVGLTRWIEKMESVFNISGCAIENQVKFATCTLLGAALTWWNGQIRTLGPKAYAMTWEVLKKKMTDKYCPQGEIKKLEIELWNLKVKGNDVPAYTERFQELTLICTKFVANETEKVDKYISGLPDNIYGNVKSARPKMLDETIELANDLMDQKLRTYAERQSDNKRKADDSSRNNHGHQQ